MKIISFFIANRDSLAQKAAVEICNRLPYLYSVEDAIEEVKLLYLGFEGILLHGAKGTGVFRAAISKDLVYVTLYKDAINMLKLENPVITQAVNTALAILNEMSGYDDYKEESKMPEPGPLCLDYYE